MSESVVPKTERRSLRYDFTAVEVHEMSLKLAGKTREISATKEEAKSVAANWKAKIDGLNSEQTRLANHVADGFEYRDVECTVEYNKPEPGRKTLTRSDTKRSFDERMEQWEHNLFTQVTDDDFLESPFDKPEKVKKISKKKQSMNDNLDTLEML